MDAKLHISKIIEENIHRSVEAYIFQYIQKNQDAFAEYGIAGVEWNLQLTVLVDNGSKLATQAKDATFKPVLELYQKNLRKSHSVVIFVSTSSTISMTGFQRTTKRRTALKYSSFFFFIDRVTS